MGKRVKSGDPRAAIGYLRVSTEEQRLSPEAQRTSIESWAARERVAVLTWHLDQGISGGCDLADRPALIAAIQDLRTSRAGVLIVAKRDRLARDIAVASAVDRAVASCGGRVVSADGVANGEGPADDFLRSILDAAAQYERALIRGRTKAALAAKRARGERIGNVPFGFSVADNGVTLVENVREQMALAEARALRRRGMTLRAIAQELAFQGIVSRAGTPIALSRLHKITLESQ